MSNTALIVEASPQRRRLLEERVRDDSLFAHRLFCSSWTEAGRHLQEKGVDVLFACGESLHEGGLHGLKRLCRREEASSVPAIVFVAQSDQQGRLQALDSGAWDCLDYATPPAEIAARLRRHLENRRRLEELREIREILAHEASTDPLTGTFNRRHFHATLQAESARSSRYEDPFAVMMVDIDHFKRINDRCGHPFGDRVLRAVARAIGGAVRRYDTLCRYGGEEFVLLMPKANASNALQVANRVTRRVTALTRQLPGLPGPLTVSIGICHSSGLSEVSPESLIEQADAALYLAKEKGRDRIEIYTSEQPLRSPSEQRVVLAVGLG